MSRDYSDGDVILRSCGPWTVISIVSGTGRSQYAAMTDYTKALAIARCIADKHQSEVIDLTKEGK